MSGMATEPGMPGLPGEAGPRGWRATAVWVVVVLAGSAVLGLLGGLIWGEFAPRAMLQEVGRGTAELMNAETHAFFGADVWFGGIGAVAGLLTGVLGYRYVVAPRKGDSRAVMAAALIIGAVAAEFIMLWLGEQIGLPGYNHDLASSAKGTVFAASLALGAKTMLTFWPMLTAIVLLVAEWGTSPAGDQPPGDVFSIGQS